MGQGRVDAERWWWFGARAWVVKPGICAYVAECSVVSGGDTEDYGDEDLDAAGCKM